MRNRFFLALCLSLSIWCRSSASPVTFPVPEPYRTYDDVAYTTNLVGNTVRVDAVSTNGERLVSQEGKYIVAPKCAITFTATITAGAGWRLSGYQLSGEDEVDLNPVVSTLTVAGGVNLREEWANKVLVKARFVKLDRSTPEFPDPTNPLRYNQVQLIRAKVRIVDLYDPYSNVGYGQLGIDPLTAQAHPLVGGADANGDGVPDFADGIEQLGTGGNNRSGKFEPVSLVLIGFDLSRARVKFVYSGSDPAGVTYRDTPEGKIYSAPAGDLRLWCKDGNYTRSSAPPPVGDYVSPNTVYSLQDLAKADVSSGHFVFFLEAVRAPGSGASVQAYVDAAGDGTWIETGLRSGGTDGLRFLVISPKTVAFGGDDYWQLTDDTGTNYDAPHWKDDDGDGQITGAERQVPVSFKRGATPRVEATFTAAGLSGISGASVLVKMYGPDGIRLDPKPATKTGDLITLNSVLCDAPFKSAVDLYVPASATEGSTLLKLRWQVSVNGGVTYSEPCVTSHIVYLTHNKPKAALHDAIRQETLFHLSCLAAKGFDVGSEASLTEYLWAVFNGRPPISKYRLGKKQAAILKYYNPWSTNVTLSWPLLAGDGNGQCGAFTDLFLNLRRSQGLDSTGMHRHFTTTLPSGVLPIRDHGLLVKNFSYAPAGFSSLSGSGYTHRNVVEGSSIVNDTDNGLRWSSAPAAQVTHSGGIPGQGSPNPKPIFNNHQFAVVGGVIYDASYGYRVTGTAFSAYVADNLAGRWAATDETVAPVATVRRVYNFRAPITEADFTFRTLR